jgi:predicted DNA-binding transcriptional regulator AlpA
LRQRLLHNASIVIIDGTHLMTTLKANSEDYLLHPTEVAKLLNVSDSWLAKSRLTGTGPVFVKIGRAVRYRLAAVQDFIKARTQTSTSKLR